MEYLRTENEVADEDFERVIAEQIIVPIPEITREFTREDIEVLTLPTKNGGYVQIPMENASVVKKYSDGNTRFYIRDNFGKHEGDAY